MQPIQENTIAHRNIFIKSVEVEIGKEIGRGAFGVVYKAKYKNQQVVVKKLQNMSERQLKEFEKEISVNAQLPPHKVFRKIHILCFDFHLSLTLSLFCSTFI